MKVAMTTLDEIDKTAEKIRAEMETINAARDQALTRARELTRNCAATIKAVHRENWDDAQRGLNEVREAAKALIEGVKPHPDLYYSGYTQDGLKEYVEAFVTYAVVRDEPLPSIDELGVTGSTYLN